MPTVMLREDEAAPQEQQGLLVGTVVPKKSPGGWGLGRSEGRSSRCPPRPLELKNSPLS